MKRESKRLKTNLKLSSLSKHVMKSHFLYWQKTIRDC